MSTKSPGEIATQIMLAAEASGIGIEDVEEALEDWTEGPFRDSDWSEGLRKALRLVTPNNAAAVITAVGHFSEE